MDSKLTPLGQETVKKLRNNVLPYLLRSGELTNIQYDYLVSGLTVLQYYGWKQYTKDKGRENE